MKEVVKISLSVATIIFIIVKFLHSAFSALAAPTLLQWLPLFRVLFLIIEVANASR